jgi:hypothetical protein
VYLKNIKLQETRTGAAYEKRTETNVILNFVLVEVLSSLVNAVLDTKEKLSLKSLIAS